MAKGIIDSEGRKIEFEPPAPTIEKRGGVYATTVDDTTGMAEVVIGSDGKAYVDALSVDIGGEF